MRGAVDLYMTQVISQHNKGRDTEQCTRTEGPLHYARVIIDDSETYDIYCLTLAGYVVRY